MCSSSTTTTAFGGRKYFISILMQALAVATRVNGSRH